MDSSRSTHRHAILMASPILRTKNAHRPSTTFRSFPLIQSSDMTTSSSPGDLARSLDTVSTRTFAQNSGIDGTSAAAPAFRLAARVHVMVRGAMLHVRPLGRSSSCGRRTFGCRSLSSPAARRAFVTYSTTTSNESGFRTLSSGRYVQVLGGGRYLAIEGKAVRVIA